MKKQLTERQAAVLETVRRRGTATLLDLREDFPDLAPSVVARVLDALSERDLVERSGDPALIFLGGVEFRPVGVVHEPTPVIWRTSAATGPLPKLYLSHLAEYDWLIALEFGRVDDGQDPDDWRGVSDHFGYRHGGEARREVGFKILEFSSFDPDHDDVREIWSGPRFDAPVLGLSAVSAGEIILAARALFGEHDSVNRNLFSAAIDADGEDAVALWLACLQSGDPMAHFGLGCALFDLDRYPEAYRHLRHYTEIAPHGAWPWCWRGQAAAAVGEHAEARMAYERAIEIEDAGGEETDAREHLDAL